MHPNFFHWHDRVAVKPDLGILEARWNASAKYAEELVEADIVPLAQMIVLVGVEAEYAKRFGDALLKVEPSFPTASNAELLRVMAAAVVFVCLEKPSEKADALAMGIRAFAFPDGRAKPVCDDIMNRVTTYLAEEGERLRPNIDAGELEKAEKKVDVQIAALKVAVDGNTALGVPILDLGKGLLATVKDSHSNLGRVIKRLKEESQYVWWLVGGMSEVLNKRRKDLAAEEYALPLAQEAAARVEFLPPAASVELILEEVLAQCGKVPKTAVVLAELVASSDQAWINKLATDFPAKDSLPIASLLFERKNDGKIKADTLKKFGISAKTKCLPIDLSRQYFRELMFAKAIEAMR